MLPRSTVFQLGGDSVIYQEAVPCPSQMAHRPHQLNHMYNYNVNQVQLGQLSPLALHQYSISQVNYYLHVSYLR